MKEHYGKRHNSIVVQSDNKFARKNPNNMEGQRVELNKSVGLEK